MKKKLISIFFSIFLSTNAYAHSWYDKDCCDIRDCAPVIKREKVKGGWVLQTKFGVAFLPQRVLDMPESKSISIRQSQDLKWHACIVYDETGDAFLKCVYLPIAF